MAVRRYSRQLAGGARARFVAVGRAPPVNPQAIREHWPMSLNRSRKTNTSGISEGARSVVSLLILLHLFCVFVSLLGNESASVLRNRLAAVLAPYTRLVNLDPEFTAGFHLTHAMEYEDDHQLVVELGEPAQTTPYPAPGQRWSGFPLGFRELRWRMLARRLGVLATEQNNDEAMAELARAIGQAVFAETQVDRFVLRCRRLRPSELDSDVDRTVDDAATYETLYGADVVRDHQGVVRIHKQIETEDAAPLRGA
jgi:hypothetical protein